MVSFIKRINTSGLRREHRGIPEIALILLNNFPTNTANHLLFNSYDKKRANEDEENKIFKIEL